MLPRAELRGGDVGERAAAARAHVAPSRAHVTPSRARTQDPDTTAAFFCCGGILHESDAPAFVSTLPPIAPLVITSAPPPPPAATAASSSKRSIIVKERYDDVPFYAFEQAAAETLLPAPYE